MTFKKKLIVGLCVIFAFFAGAFAQYYYFDDGGNTYQQGCSETVSVRINSEGAPVRGGRFHLILNPNDVIYPQTGNVTGLRLFFVASSQTFQNRSSAASPSWKSGSNYTILEADRVNYETDYVGTNGLYANVKFTPVFRTSTYTIDFGMEYEPGSDTTETTLSKLGGTELINSQHQVSHLTGTFAVLQEPCIADTNKPTITNISIANNSTKKSNLSGLTFSLKDVGGTAGVQNVPYVWSNGVWTGNVGGTISNQYGIDISRFELKLRGNGWEKTIINTTPGFSVSSWDGKTWQNNGLNVNIRISSDGLLPEGVSGFGIEKTITGTFTFYDLAGNSGTQTIVFNKPAGPTLISGSRSPANGAVYVNLRDPIKLGIQDDWAGVDSGTIKITVAGIDGTSYGPYVFSGADLNLSGVQSGANQPDYYINISNHEIFPTSGAIKVSVYAKDMEGNVDTISDYTFYTRPNCSEFQCCDPALLDLGDGDPTYYTNTGLVISGGVNPTFTGDEQNITGVIDCNTEDEGLSVYNNTEFMLFTDDDEIIINGTGVKGVLSGNVLTLSYIIDSAEIIVDKPSSGQILTTGDVDIRWHLTGVDDEDDWLSGYYIEIYSGDTLITGGFVDGTGIMEQLSDGEYEFIVYPIDLGGRTGSAATGTFSIDTSVPSVEITGTDIGMCSPAGTIYTVTGTFSEAVTGIDVSTLTVTGGTVQNLQNISSTEAVWTVSAGSNGTGIVLVSISIGAFEDLAGNTNTTGTDELSWNYDGEGPEFTLEDVERPECTDGTMIISGVTQVGCASGHVSPYSWDAGANWGLTGTNTAYSGGIGEKIMTVRVRDAFGNYTEKTGKYTWTNVNPSVEDISVENVGLGTGVNWRELSNAHEGTCGTGTIGFSGFVSSGNHGTCIEEGGIITYVADTDTEYEGEDSCVFEITDDEGYTATGVITFTGIDTKKPTCEISYNENVCTSGDIALTMNATGAAEYSWNGFASMSSDNLPHNVHGNGVYTGYVRDGVGNTGICTVEVETFDDVLPIITVPAPAALTAEECTIIEGNIQVVDNGGCGNGFSYLWGGFGLGNDLSYSGYSEVVTGKTATVSVGDPAGNIASGTLNYSWTDTGVQLSFDEKIISDIVLTGGNAYDTTTGALISLFGANEGNCGIINMSVSAGNCSGLSINIDNGNVVITGNNGISTQGYCEILFSDDDGNTETGIIKLAVDTINPDVTLVGTNVACMDNSEFAVTGTFTENVDGFASSDIAIVGGHVGSFAGDGNEYVWTVVADPMVEFSVQVPVGAAFDDAGNANTASNTLTGLYDNAGPNKVTLSERIKVYSETSKFTWQVASDSGCVGVSGYMRELYEGTCGEGTLKDSGTTQFGTENFTVSGLEGSGSYCRRVMPVDNFGNTGDWSEDEFIVDLSDIGCDFEYVQACTSGTVQVTLIPGDAGYTDNGVVYLSRQETGDWQNSASLTTGVTDSGQTLVGYIYQPNTDKFNSCEFVASNLIDKENPEIASVVADSVPECTTGTATVTVSDEGCGQGTYTYSWDGGQYGDSNLFRQYLSESGTQTINLKVKDNAGNESLSTGIVFTWTDSPISGHDFIGNENVGNTGRTVNWREMSEVSDGDCGSETISFSGFINSGTKGTCTRSGDEITYTPNSGQTGSDICSIQVKDDEGGTKDIVISWKGIDTKAPICTTVATSPEDTCVSGSLVVILRTDELITSAVGGDIDRLAGVLGARGRTFVNGTYLVEITDEVGNTGSCEVTVNSINTGVLDAPVWLSPANGSNTNDNTLTLSWSGVSANGCRGVSGYEVQIIPSGGELITGFTNVNSWTTPKLSDGEYTIKVKTIDILGGESEWTEIIITIDTEKPTCDIQYPIACVSGDVQLSMVATGADYYSWINFDDMTNSLSTNIVSSNGTYYCFVKDLAGNTGTNSVEIANIDTGVLSDPSDLAIVGGTPTNDNTPEFTWSQPNNGECREVSGYQVQILSGGDPIATIPVDGTGWTPSSSLPDGEYTIIIKTEDTLSGESEGTEITFVVDTTAPNCSIEVITENCTNSGVEIKISGDTSDILTYSWWNGTTGNFGSDITTIVNENGEYTGYVYDEAGNEGVCVGVVGTGIQDQILISYETNDAVGFECEVVTGSIVGNTGDSCGKDDLSKFTYSRPGGINTSEYGTSSNNVLSGFGIQVAIMDGAGNSNTDTVKYTWNDTGVTLSNGASQSIDDVLTGTFEKTVVEIIDMFGATEGACGTGNITVTGAICSGASISVENGIISINPDADLDGVDGYCEFEFGDNEGEKTTTGKVTFIVDTKQPGVILTGTNLVCMDTDTFDVTGIFTEAMLGFESGDVNVSGGTVSNFNGNGSEYTWTVTMTPMVETTVFVPVGVATDLNGNENTESNKLTGMYDNVGPNDVSFVNWQNTGFSRSTTLRWNATSDSGCVSVSGYNYIFVSGIDCSNNILLQGSTSNTSLVVNDLSHEATYSLCVQPVDTLGNVGNRTTGTFVVDLNSIGCVINESACSSTGVVLTLTPGEGVEGEVSLSWTGYDDMLPESQLTKVVTELGLVEGYIQQNSGGTTIQSSCTYVVQNIDKENPTITSFTDVSVPECTTGDLNIIATDEGCGNTGLYYSWDNSEFALNSTIYSLWSGKAGSKVVDVQVKDNVGNTVSGSATIEWTDSPISGNDNIIIENVGRGSGVNWRELSEVSDGACGSGTVEFSGFVNTGSHGICTTGDGDTIVYVPVDGYTGSDTCIIEVKDDDEQTIEIEIIWEGVDTEKPSVIITGNAVGMCSPVGTIYTITGSFSEAVTGIDELTLNVVNGSVQSFEQISSTEAVWTVRARPDYVYEEIVDGVNTLTVCNPNNNSICITMMDRNMGAITNDTNSTGSYGYYYQWGNNYGFVSCHENICSDFSNGETMATDVRIDTTGYGPGNYYNSNVFIKLTESPYTWLDPNNNNLRGGEEDNVDNGYGYPVLNPEDRQGPCDTGYHVPSLGERINFTKYWVENYSGAGDGGLRASLGGIPIHIISQVGVKSFIKDLKIPNSYISNSTRFSRYWSSSSYGERKPFINFGDTRVYYAGENSVDFFAYSVRCFKDVALIPGIIEQDDIISIGIATGSFVDLAGNTNTTGTDELSWDYDGEGPEYTLEDVEIPECTTGTMIISGVVQDGCASGHSSPYSWDAGNTWGLNSTNTAYSGGIGEKIMTVRVRDAFGNYTEKTGKYTWTNVNPSMDDISLDNVGLGIGVNWMELSNAHEGECGTGTIEFSGFIDDGSHGTCTEEGGIIIYVADTDAEYEGEDSCIFEIIDDDGYTATGMITFTGVDTQRPTVELQGGVGEQCTSGNTFIVTGTFSEEVNGVTQQTLTGENVEINGFNNIDGKVYEWIVEMKGGTGRVWILTGGITDSIGNELMTGDEKILGNYDIYEPSQISLSKPDNGWLSFSNSIGFEWTESNDEGCAGISGYILQICEDELCENVIRSSYVLGTGKTEGSLGSSTGTWTGYWRVMSEDIYGNTGVSVIHSFMVDARNPNCSIVEQEICVQGGVQLILTGDRDITISDGGGVDWIGTGMYFTGIVSENGSIVVIVKDVENRTGQCEINVTKHDAEGPEIVLQTGEVYECEGTIIQIVANDTGCAGINGYVFGNDFGLGIFQTGNELVVTSGQIGNVGGIQKNQVVTVFDTLGNERTDTGYELLVLDVPVSLSDSNYGIGIITGTVEGLNVINIFGASEGICGVDDLSVELGECSNATGTLIANVLVVEPYDNTEGNGECEVYVKDNEGNISTGHVSYQVDTQAPICEITYNITGWTNQDVIATLSCSGDDWSVINNTGVVTITETGEVIFEFEDGNGNTGSITEIVDWIDKTAPECSIEYSPDSPTSGDVVATLTGCSELVSVTNNDGITYTFIDTGTFIFEFVDDAGNTGEAIATVDRIDKDAPTCTVNVPEGRTNTGVTLTMDVVGDTTGYSWNDVDWLGTNTGLFVENTGLYTGYVRDEVWNMGICTGLVEKIDKQRPTITLEGTNVLGCTNEPTFVVTGIFSEGVSGFTQDKISITNGNISDFTGVELGIIYTWTVTMIGGETKVSINSGVVEDRAWNKNTESNELTSNYDNAGPGRITMIRPDSSSGMNYGSTLVLQWNGVEDQGCSEVSGYVYKVCDNPDCTGVVYSGATDLTGVEIENLGTGTYYWTIYPEDNYGNTGEETTGQVVVDLTQIGCRFVETACSNTGIILSMFIDGSGTHLSWTGESDWEPVTSLSIEVTESWFSITGYVYDDETNRTGYCEHTVSNIDIVNPSIISITHVTGYECETITGSVEMTDEGCGSGTIAYIWDGLAGTNNFEYGIFNESGNINRIIYVTGTDEVGNTVTTGVQFMWLNSPISVNDFTGNYNVGNTGRSVNWREMSLVSDGACGSGTIIDVRVVNSGFKGECMVEGDIVTYTPRVGQTGSDVCILRVRDDEGDTGSISIAWEGVDTEKPSCNLALQDTQSCTSGDVILSLSSVSTDVVEYSFDGISWTTNTTTGVNEIGTYTGYVKDGAGNTGMCNLEVTGGVLDLDEPELETIDWIGYECSTGIITVTGTDNSCGLSGLNYLWSWLGNTTNTNEIYCENVGSQTVEVTVFDGVGHSTGRQVTYTWQNIPVTGHGFTVENVGTGITVDWFERGNISGGICELGDIIATSTGMCEISGHDIIYTPTEGVQGEESCTITITDGDEEGSGLEIEITFTGVDTRGPSVVSLQGGMGEVCMNKGTFTVTGTFSEEVTGVIISTLTGENVNIVDFTGNGNIYEWTVEMLGGTGKVWINSGIVRDLIGNENEGSEILILGNYDGTVPLGVDLLNPGIDAVFDRRTVGFEWTVSEDTGCAGLYGYVLNVCSDSGCSESVDATLTTDTGTQFTLQDNGDYYWTIIILDTLGNTRTGEIRHFVVESNGPVCHIEQSACSNSSVTLTLTGNKEISIESGNITWQQVSQDTYSVELTQNIDDAWAIVKDSDNQTGYCHLQVTNYDNAGPDFEFGTIEVYEGTPLNINIVANDTGCAEISGYRFGTEFGLGEWQTSSGLSITADQIGNIGGTGKDQVVSVMDTLGNITTKTGKIIIKDVKPSITQTGTIDGVQTGEVIVDVIDLLGAEEGDLGTGDLEVEIDECIYATGYISGQYLIVNVAKGAEGIGYCTVKIKDNEGSYADVDGVIEFEVDTKEPVCTGFVFNPAGWTSGDSVSVSLTGCSEPIYSGDTTFVFTGNGDHTFEIEDDMGNTGEVVVHFTGFDREAPNFDFDNNSGYECQTGILTISNAVDTGIGLSGLPYSFDGTTRNTLNTKQVYSTGVGEISISGYVRDGLGNYKVVQVGYTFNDSEPTATGFSIYALSGAEVNWKELSNARDGACGSGTLTASVSGGTAGICSISGDILIYEPNFTSSVLIDTCDLIIYDDEGSRVNVTIEIKGINDYPDVELVTPINGLVLDSGNIKFAWRGQGNSDVIDRYVYNIWSSNDDYTVEQTGLEVSIDLKPGAYHWNVYAKYIDATTGGLSDTYSFNVVGESSGLAKDKCPNGDFSDSFYDGRCDPSGSHSAADICGAASSSYSDELKGAYVYAYSYGITTMCPIQSAYLDGYLIRSHFAKMISEFAVNVLGKIPEKGKAGCDKFNDIGGLNDELRSFVITSCELNLMGQESDGVTPAKSFSPDDYVTRAQFGTVLSRLLFGDVYNIKDESQVYMNEGFWYKNHLEALKNYGIMTKIDGDWPNSLERRGRVMLMLERADEYGVFAGKIPAKNGVKALFDE